MVSRIPNNRTIFPLIAALLLEQCSQGCCNLAKVFDESSIIIRQAEELSDFMDILGLGLFSDHFDLLVQYPDYPSTHNVTTEFHFWLIECAFEWPHIKPMLP